MEFRADINGLRAWAVVLVLLYHFSVPGFSGGFIGVDVFFVISGYLMTAIILGRRSGEGFSILGFYLARARRIVPALAVTCMGTLAFGWFWLGAADYTTLGMHAGSAILFFSNLVFAGEAGYFDVESHEKWLLHTWSLSVEWQFYLLYPLLLAVAARSARIAERGAVWAAFIVSLAYALWLSRADPGEAFYVLPARAWELLAGALVYLHAPRDWKPAHGRWVEYVGFALILGAGLAVDMTHWPGPLVAVPVLGAVLVLLADRRESVLTAHPVVQAIGRWSYSIYLWHWPLLVAALYLRVPRGVGLYVALFATSVALGALSYRLVEEPIRHSAFGRRIRWRGMFAIVLMVILPVAVIVWTHGAPVRLPRELARIEEQMLSQENNLDRTITGQAKCGWGKQSGRLPECRFGAGEGAETVAVWGDSHASKSMPAIDAAARRHGLGVTLYYRNGCRPLQGLVSLKGGTLKDCRAFNRAVLERISAKPELDSVLLIASWPYDLGAGKRGDADVRTYFGASPLDDVEARHREYLGHLVDDLCALKRAKRRVAIIAPLPYYGVDVPKTMASTYLFEGRLSVPSMALREHLARNASLLDAMADAHARCGVEVLDPLPYFCDAGTCQGALDGVPVYSDDNHLSKRGNIAVQPMYEDFFAKDAQRR